MENVHQLNTDLSIHEQDLQSAIYYLPHNFDLEVLCKCLKHVYGEVGIEIAIKWVKIAKIELPKDFKKYWNEQTLSKYRISDFDNYVSELIYDIAKENRWVPKGLENGKNKSKRPSKKVLKDQSMQIDYENDVQADICRAFEKELPEHKKSFVGSGVINLEGACYIHPAMSRIERESLDGNNLHKLEKIVDCEILIDEAIEYLIRQPGQIEDDKEVRYRIRLDNKKGKEVLTIASYEELTTKTRFSSFLVSKGFVKFLGTTPQFDKFHEFLINDQEYPTVREIPSWGEYKPGKFLFKNGLYDVKEKVFFPADGNHRIRYQNRILICPDGNELVQPPELSVPTDAITSVDFLAEKFTLWESLNGRLNVRSSLGYAIACLYNQRIIKKDSAFPLLFKYGERGTGKSSSMDWFMTLFGYKSGNRQSVSKNNTIKGTIRVMTLAVSFPFFLDDYRNHENNNQVPDYTSSILNWYHQIGSSMAKKSTDHQTIDTPMKAAVVMTGNEKPLDPAAISRLVILNYNNFVKKEELSKIPEITQYLHRFSEFTFHVLNQYDWLYENFERYTMINRKWLANQGFEGRTVNNWSLLLAGIQTIPLILPHLSIWEVQFEDLRNEICQEIRKEEALQKEVNPLHEFFDAIEYYATQKIDQESLHKNQTNLLDHRHFRCKVGQHILPSTRETYTGFVLYISLNGIWRVLQDKNSDITRVSTLNMIETKLQNSSYYINHGVQVPLTKSLSEKKESNRRCYAINVEELTKNQKLEELVEKAHEYEKNRPYRIKQKNGM